MTVILPFMFVFLRCNCYIEAFIYPTSSVPNQFSNLKISKTASADGFSLHTLKTLGASLTYPLSCLFDFIFYTALYLKARKFPLILLFIKKRVSY